MGVEIPDGVFAYKSQYKTIPVARYGGGMGSLYKVAYVIGVILAVSAVWHFLLPPDMEMVFKIRFSAYVVLIFIVGYFVFKNIIFAKKKE